MNDQSVDPRSIVAVVLLLIVAELTVIGITTSVIWHVAVVLAIFEALFGALCVSVLVIQLVTMAQIHSKHSYRI